MSDKKNKVSTWDAAAEEAGSVATKAVFGAVIVGTVSYVVSKTTGLPVEYVVPAGIAAGIVAGTALGVHEAARLHNAVEDSMDYTDRAIFEATGKKPSASIPSYDEKTILALRKGLGIDRLAKKLEVDLDKAA